MAHSLVIDASKYAIYVKVLAGEGDGTLVYIDARGHIHIVGPDPGPQVREKLQAAAKQVEVAVAHFQAAAGGVKAQ